MDEHRLLTFADRDRVVQIMLSRLKLLTIPRRMFLDILAGRVNCIEGLPDDAVVFEVQYDFASQGFTLLLQSQSFDPVSEGEQVPHISVVFKSKEWA